MMLSLVSYLAGELLLSWGHGLVSPIEELHHWVRAGQGSGTKLHERRRHLLVDSTACVEFCIITVLVYLAHQRGPRWQTPKTPCLPFCKPHTPLWLLCPNLFEACAVAAG